MNRLTRIKYDASVMKYMSLFESVTRARLKDCIMGEKVIFIVEEGEMGKAIGKHGANVKMLESMLKKSIRVIEFNNNITEFIGNLISPIRPKALEAAEGGVVITANDMKTRGMLIGRDRKNVEQVKEIVGRYFGNIEIKVD